MVELVAVVKSNISFYQNFEICFDLELNRYQSRIYPGEHAALRSWYYIQYRGQFIGSVWLETEKKDSHAVLGIFIADQACRSRGIGSWAIRQIVAQDAVRMGVNEICLHVREDNVRAFRCYGSLGFQEIGRFRRPNGISVIAMHAPVARILQSDRPIREARKAAP